MAEQTSNNQIDYKDDVLLIAKLEDLRKKAFCPVEEFKDYEKYFKGNFEYNINKLHNANNVVNQIIEAKNRSYYVDIIVKNRINELQT